MALTPTLFRRERERKEELNGHGSARTTKRYCRLPGPVVHLLFPDGLPAKTFAKCHQPRTIRSMDIRYELNGLSFVWDTAKAAANPRKHDGVTFEQA